MNNSQFMDKKIMDLSSSSPDFIDLMNNTKISLDDEHHHHQHRIVHSGLEDILPSYDFQPIRPPTTSSAARVWSASDFKHTSTSPNNRGFGSLDSIEPAQLVLSEIDRTMKKHADTLLLVMEGVSSRLTQLETTTYNLENLVHDLKVSVDNTHGTTDGKLSQLQNILSEVQSGVQLLKDKQEIVEAQLQLSKLEVSKVDQHPKAQSLHVDPTTAQSPALFPMPQFPLTFFPQPPSSAAAPSSQLLAQLPTQFPPQHEPYCPPPSHSQSPPPNQPPYQAPQQPLPSSGYSLEEQPPYTMQSYPPRQQPTAGSAPSQQFYNAAQPQPSMYEGAGGRSNSGFPSGYSSEPYPYTGSPMASGKPTHISSSGDGSSSSRSESRVPIDDVIDRVTTMGFPRDQVRATVRKLTENGQAVDLNVVLDKLMNEGGAPPGGWYGGR